MKLKEVRKLIYSDCQVVIEGNTYSIDPQASKCEVDELEVEVIRSRIRLINGYAANTVVEILLKMPENASDNPDQSPVQ